MYVGMPSRNKITFCMTATDDTSIACGRYVESYRLTNESYINYMEEPHRDPLAKYRPPVIFIMTTEIE